MPIVASYDQTVIEGFMHVKPATYGSDKGLMRSLASPGSSPTGCVPRVSRDGPRPLSVPSPRND